MSWVFPWIGYIALFLGGFWFGRAMRRMSTHRCDEIIKLKVRKKYDFLEGRHYSITTVERCEEELGHDGPCCISEGLERPYFWEP